jgi:hypothetical protein
MGQPCEFQARKEAELRQLVWNCGTFFMGVAVCVLALLGVLSVADRERGAGSGKLTGWVGAFGAAMLFGGSNIFGARTHLVLRAALRTMYFVIEESRKTCRAKSSP